MDRLVYTSMSGAKQVMLQQASNNHNLANVSTAGFRADLDAFRSLYLQGPGYGSRVFSEEQRAGVDFSSGRVQHTGRDLDIAISGNGYIAVQTADGQEAYTRSGDLRINAGGLLETGAGHLVLGDGGPVAVPPFEKLEIGSDGSLSLQPLGQSVATLAIVGRLKLVNPDESRLVKRSDGLLVTRDGQSQLADASIRIAAGSLEASNVNAVDALVNMITLSRQFEMNIKMMEQAQENDQASASVMRLS